ncbi:protein disulfide oxidoreductase [Marichromatium bheemlicum]|uniref:Protein disulfide oxidoreductase n=1 Tax=Marichromatium bheemlicum TaxID=365339 RepID=A0ABX1I529_9GAMM|nr:protein disulfide oxidoreductase [Marichromatium bheemlicum]NKN31766.1 protein disulfide oxidoreductase [Marichromatium bheemlicum]
MTAPTDAKKPRRRQLWRWTLNLLLFIAALQAIDWWKTRTLPNGAAPPLQGITLDGEIRALADYRGAPLLVHFWATWCPICRLSEDAIAAVAEDHQVVTVAMQSGNDADIAAYLDAQGLDLVVIPDPDGAIAGRWGVGAVPTSFVIDATGAIHSSTMGLSTAPGLRARLWAAAQGTPAAETLPPPAARL